MVLSLNGFFVLLFKVALGHVATTTLGQGSWPWVLLTAIALCAMARRLAGVNRGLGPRFFPLCLPGNHSTASSTLRKSSCKDCFDGLPPPTFSKRCAIQCKFGSPSSSSLQVSRKARAFATCHAHNRPSGASSQRERRVSWLSFGIVPTEQWLVTKRSGTCTF